MGGLGCPGLGWGWIGVGLGLGQVAGCGSTGGSVDGWVGGRPCVLESISSECASFRPSVILFVWLLLGVKSALNDECHRHDKPVGAVKQCYVFAFCVFGRAGDSCLLLFIRA